ncbi:hypothetical protein LEMLEM_LOCUS21452, partial [Lemmus lemmus]
GHTAWHGNEPREQKWLKKARQQRDSEEVDEEAVTVSKSWCQVNWSHSKRQPSKVTLGNAFPQTHFPLSPEPVLWTPNATNYKLYKKITQ